MSVPPRMSMLNDAAPARELGASFGAPGAEDELGLDDAGLIAEYLGGNPAAYGELVRRHQIAIFRLLLGLLADEDLAEEACEAVFLTAERRLADLADGNAFYQWLLGIAREVSVKLNERRSHEVTSAPNTADPREHVRREIHAVLQQLAPDQRLVLVLVELRGAPDRDVAAALGCSLAEVPDLVAAARGEFARVLAGRADTTRKDGVPSPIGARLRPGDAIDGRYEVDRLLAEGGMGSVYLARRLRDGLAVALKTMLAELVSDERSKKRFAREIEAVARIDHENFVKVLDHGQADGRPFLVMELLEGRSLGELLHAVGRVEAARALAWTAAVLRGLVHAHGVGVVHRDMKPDNVFVVEPGSERERIKLLDLGLAKLAIDDEGQAHAVLTERGMVCGTPAYMSPEQALGEEVDHRTDLYAVAVMLFHLLTGRLPFESASSAAVLVMHVSSAPPRLVERVPELDDPMLQRILDRGLAKQPEGRYPDAAAFLADVERAASGVTALSLPAVAAPAHDPALVTRKAAPIAPRAARPVWPWVAAGAGLAAAAVIAWLLLRP